MQFTEPQGNALKFRGLKGKELDNLFINFSFRLFDKNEAIELNTAEMATIFHFPKGISFHLPAYVCQSQKTLRRRLICPKKEFCWARILPRRRIVGIYMKDDARRRHFYLIGQTGTGKSVLLKNMIVQDMEQGKGRLLNRPAVRTWKIF